MVNFDASGVIVLNKPEGITSHGAVQRVKRTLGARKCGHAGTLDPFATGVLLVMVNEATRLAPYLTELDKRYQATIKLGSQTDTLDRTGRVVCESAVPSLTVDQIEAAAEELVGLQLQTPPSFSAKKVNGVRLYKLARRGKSRKVSPKQVEIYSIDVISWSEEEKLLTIRVHCSKGTYVRVLARDLANRLGTCGHLYRLIRLACGQFEIDDAISLSRIGELKSEGRLGEVLIPPSEALPALKGIRVSRRGVLRLLDGRHLEKKDLVKPPPGVEDEAIYKALDENDNLVAIVKAVVGDTRFGQVVAFKPVRVFVRAAESSLSEK
ncbi:MAG TPA: tRNA pseudouridine(55) synthase TruB [Proteobacteria bacterium]|nr:tRNA pseudouridine(55) synthase TruB [Pseudomonadota bacterium]